ncbi:hypothetical protein DM860_012307 [Cuscuta australis]|uniref:F-box domain-containing protein n=1 Tax=Cuscuta australis TaxID=267555 RepID=A0A328DPV6_9ASTE|nr:hypothetical protein DM860_012307 [Cuscuta australis]
MVIECLPQISHLLCSVFNLQDPPRRGKASIGQLPDDILIDILSRLPADTVLRCRTVCKDWRSLTLSHYFTGLQAERAPSAVIVQDSPALMMVIECLPQISHLLCSVFNLQDPPRRGKASIGQLPDDILIDILSRLPADTVLGCRTVCQDWRSLTLSHYFTGLQAERAPSAVIVQGIQLGLHKKSDDYYIYDAVSKKLRHIPFNLNIYKGFYFPSVRGACGGPFLHLKSYATLWKDGTNIFSSHPIKCDFVFNIITQQLLGVRSELQDFVCGVYFHKATNECNYLCVRRVSAEERCFQYFSYNIVSRTTKKIACSRFSCRQDANNYPVALNGALHMMTCDDCMHAVLVFEIDSRKLCALPHPEVECVNGQVDSHKLMTLFVHDGHLGMCHARDLGVGRFDIWILEDYAKWRWVRKARFTLRKPRFGLDTMRDMLAGGCFMVSSVGKDELFIGWFSRLLLVVNVKEQSIKEIKVPHKLKSANIRRCAAYTSSLMTHHGWLG